MGMMCLPRSVRRNATAKTATMLIGAVALVMLVSLRAELLFGEFARLGGTAVLEAPPAPAGSLPRYACTEPEAARNAERFARRNREWWPHSACPDSVWKEKLPQALHDATLRWGAGTTTPTKKIVVFDIGCNKGYASMEFLDALTPWSKLNSKALYTAMQQVQRAGGFSIDKACGVCSDCYTKLAGAAQVETAKIYLAPIEETAVYCFEPAPSTYKLLKEMDARLLRPVPQSGQPRGQWLLRNLGFSNTSGLLHWHPTCASAVGSELCSIVAPDTPNAIKVPTSTVDDFVNREKLSVVHVLKIDAEGFDPLVLDGAAGLLRQNRAIFVVFEFNPGLRHSKAKDGGTHGFWASPDDHGPDLRRLHDITDKLDHFGYDCYLDSRVADRAGPIGPALYRVTGNCMGGADPRMTGWGNAVCAARKFRPAAQLLLKLSTELDPARATERGL